MDHSFNACVMTFGFLSFPISSGCDVAPDVIFSLDLSLSIQDDDFEVIIPAVDAMIDQLPLAGPGSNDPNRFRVGIQTFNRTQLIQKQLNDFTTDLGNLTLERDGGTDIQAALT